MSFDSLLGGEPANERRRHVAASHRLEVETPWITPTSTIATISMIFGLGVFLSFGFTGLPAVLLGHFAWEETSTGERAGHGMTVTGLFLGYLAIIAWVALIVFIATVGKDVRMPQFPIPSTTN